MSTWDTVAIVGVGLIGSSIGRALRQRQLARQVIGIGRRTSTLDTAQRLGAITQATTDLAAGVAQADLVVVCTPVGQIVEHVQQAAAAARPGTVLTDAGSTKGQIVRELEAALPQGTRFVGSHPLAGSERGGPEASDPELLTGRLVLLTPTAQTDPHALDTIRQFWIALGARVREMNPDEHDRALAATSHVPHLVAASLAAATPAEWLALTAGGWRDTTRISAGDPELWRQIFVANRLAVTEAAERFHKAFTAFRLALSEATDLDGSQALCQLLEDAKRIRDQWAEGPAAESEE